MNLLYCGARIKTVTDYKLCYEKEDGIFYLIQPSEENLRKNDGGAYRLKVA